MSFWDGQGSFTSCRVEGVTLLMSEVCSGQALTSQLCEWGVTCKAHSSMDPGPGHRGPSGKLLGFRYQITIENNPLVTGADSSLSSK